MYESVECLGGESSGCFAESIEMDYRAEEAVKAALHRAKVCKKPIARYDMDTKRAYIEYPNGERKYVE